MRIFLIDNFDSFTYNLLHYFEIAGAEVEVCRNDCLPENLDHHGAFDAIVISPGPSKPQDAGLLMPFLHNHMCERPILGICLGMQAIGIYFGMPLGRAPVPVHGKTSIISHDEMGIFTNIPNPCTVMRYHSLILHGDMPQELIGSAYTSEHLLMGLRHKTLPIEAVQFHPESIETTEGLAMIQNWIGNIKRITSGN